MFSTIFVVLCFNFKGAKRGCTSCWHSAKIMRSGRKEKPFTAKLTSIDRLWRLLMKRLQKKFVVWKRWNNIGHVWLSVKKRRSSRLYQSTVSGFELTSFVRFNSRYIRQKLDNFQMPSPQTSFSRGQFMTLFILNFLLEKLWVLAAALWEHENRQAPVL